MTILVLSTNLSQWYSIIISNFDFHSGLSILCLSAFLDAFAAQPGDCSRYHQVCPAYKPCDKPYQADQGQQLDVVKEFLQFGKGRSGHEGGRKTRIGEVAHRQKGDHKPKKLST